MSELAFKLFSEIGLELYHECCKDLGGSIDVLLVRR